LGSKLTFASYNTNDCLGPKPTKPPPRSTQAPCNGVETVGAGANARGVGPTNAIDMAVTALC